ncbi:MAG TPA: ABC transporter permease, partial [Oligoflexia bacterium]|nr:ABC transporter permease [Oligoflexia bacterium]
MRHSRIPLFTTLAIIFVFYLPIMVLVVNSFNDSRFGGNWGGFTLKWYARLLEEQQIWEAVWNTLLIAVGATLVSMVLGTAAGFALHRFQSRLQRLHFALIYTPLVIPDILMG